MKQHQTRIATVQFINSYSAGYNTRVYDFKTDIEELQEGDIVVVDTANGLSVAEVVGFKEKSHMATKWVIQKVDVEAHEERLARIERIEELKKKMEKRRKQLHDVEVYQQLAASDDQMAALLAEYDELVNNKVD